MFAGCLCLIARICRRPGLPAKAEYMKGHIAVPQAVVFALSLLAHETREIAGFLKGRYTPLAGTSPRTEEHARNVAVKENSTSPVKRRV
jgi:hypothetical protein